MLGTLASHDAGIAYAAYSKTTSVVDPTASPLEQPESSAPSVDPSSDPVEETAAPTESDVPSADSVKETAGPSEEFVESPTAATSDPGESAEPIKTKAKAKAKAEARSTNNAAQDSAISLLAAGPDGASAPYLSWNVVDESGSPVPGATFRVANRAGSDWITLVNVNDCTSGNCQVVDRDNDAGEYLAKWIGSDNPGSDPRGSTVTAGARYRLQATTAPAGYEWVSGAPSVDSNTLSWDGAGNQRTLNFGAFVVRKVSYVPMCLAGQIYGMTAAGQIRAVVDGQVTNLGQPAYLSGGAMNGLGIGANGSSVYAYQRSNSGSAAVSKAEIYRFDTSTGTWSRTGASVDSTSNGRTVQFVAGAVNLETGKYLLGGFSAQADSQVFRIWEYDPATNAITYKGRIATDGTGTANGDMAFDAKGNLFIVRGAGNKTNVYSVTAENLNSANGGLIERSGSREFNTMADVNGVAFDSDGKAYLGSADYTRRYSMPDWTFDAEVSDKMGSSTDLASCGSPPTITVEKYVEGGRVAATDQFALSLRQGSANGTLVGTATTDGSANGLQDQRVGPLPTVRNVDLHFSETAAGTTNLANYASSYRCLVDGKQTVQGNGTSGMIRIPANGQAVECRFYNSPLIAQVNVHKQVTDSKGENPEHGSNWNVGATAKATTGTINSTPASATQLTNSSGTASWKFAFGGSSHKAELAVQELMQDGYKFEDGSCTITSLDGTTKKTALNGAANNPNLGIVPGDVVDCTFVNSLKPATVSVGKRLTDINGLNPKPAAGWTVGATLDSGSAPGVTISTPATATTGTDGKVEKPWTVDFPTKPGARGQIQVQEAMQDGYDFISGSCKITADNGSTREQPIIGTSGVLTGLAPGDAAECTFTNKPKAGVVTWQKIDATGTGLRDSEWKLTGPGTNGTTAEVTDCIAGAPQDCSGPDKDPKPGQFLLAGLPWGTYTLVETKAPAGYLLDETEHAFTVGAKAPAQLVWDLGGITNEQRESLELPLTGGTGTQLFLFGGSVVLLAALGAVAWRRKMHATKN